jgi:hypothetical protein
VFDSGGVVENPGGLPTFVIKFFVSGDGAFNIVEYSSVGDFPIGFCAGGDFPVCKVCLVGISNGFDLVWEEFSAEVDVGGVVDIVSALLVEVGVGVGATEVVVEIVVANAVVDETSDGLIIVVVVGVGVGVGVGISVVVGPLSSSFCAFVKVSLLGSLSLSSVVEVSLLGSLSLSSDVETSLLGSLSLSSFSGSKLLALLFFLYLGLCFVGCFLGTSG